MADKQICILFPWEEIRKRMTRRWCQEWNRRNGMLFLYLRRGFALRHTLRMFDQRFNRSIYIRWCVQKLRYIKILLTNLQYARWLVQLLIYSHVDIDLCNHQLQILFQIKKRKMSIIFVIMHFINYLIDNYPIHISGLFRSFSLSFWGNIFTAKLDDTM